jgi:hypothetical protein
MPFSSRYIAVLLACLSSCALAQQPPAELARKVSAELDRCTKALKCEVNACASNGGLKSCYGRSNALWDQATFIARACTAGCASARNSILIQTRLQQKVRQGFSVLPPGQHD